MLRITIETIPHDRQPYPTAGDFFFADEHGNRVDGDIGTDHLVVRVSDLGDWRQELCVAVHELCEVAMCCHGGITVKQVDSFDIAYEQAREEKLLAASTEAEKLLLLADEPGDDPLAPYRRQHCLATGIERILAAELDVDWKAYEQKIESL